MLFFNSPSLDGILLHVSPEFLLHRLQIVLNGFEILLMYLVSQTFPLLSHMIVQSLILIFCCEEQIFCLLHLPHNHIVRGLMPTSR